MHLRVLGIGFWAPGVPDWQAAQPFLSGTVPWPELAAPGRPSTNLMPPNERRRAPDSVLLALTVAEQACTAARLQPAALTSVFVSKFGDLAINDYMCTILREDPAAMSPTKFHNSVHNAPSGYWSIATGAQVPATSIAASDFSVAAGLLEAAVQANEADTPILLAAYDVAAAGPMREVAACQLAFGAALVIAASDADIELGSGPSLILELEPGNGSADAHTANDPLIAANPIAAALVPLLRALAGHDQDRQLRLPLSPGLDLRLRVRP